MLSNQVSCSFVCNVELINDDKLRLDCRGLYKHPCIYPSSRLPWRVMLCPPPLMSLFSPVLTGLSLAGPKQFYCSGSCCMGGFQRAPSWACCPSNCCVVRRRVPPKALSDSSRGLASNSVVDPLSAHSSHRLPRGIAGRFRAKPASLLCHWGGSTCLGRG